ncbi:hypothetical protein RRG08_051308 [Elysia crispata]|uniref:Uncharacterized protein n=1 Tax=Elysia crispata TaxID=231223 RepID=A0AAE1CN83_9GAST|nr:hypothetical protein RRG08_051308 [Elysia crispata]
MAVMRMYRSSRTVSTVDCGQGCKDRLAGFRLTTQSVLSTATQTLEDPVRTATLWYRLPESASLSLKSAL